MVGRSASLRKGSRAFGLSHLCGQFPLPPFFLTRLFTLRGSEKGEGSGVAGMSFGGRRGVLTSKYLCAHIIMIIVIINKHSSNDNLRSTAAAYLCPPQESLSQTAPMTSFRSPFFFLPHEFSCSLLHEVFVLPRFIYHPLGVILSDGWCACCPLFASHELHESTSFAVFEPGCRPPELVLESTTHHLLSVARLADPSFLSRCSVRATVQECTPAPR